MKLTDQQRIVLRCIQLQADLSVPDTAQICGLKPNTIRRCIDQMAAEGLLSRRVMLNLSRIGLDYHCLFIAYRGPETRRAEFVQKVLETRVVEFIDCIEGEFQYQIRFFAPNLPATAAFVDRVTAGFEDVIEDSALAPITSLELLGNKALADLQPAPPTLGWSQTVDCIPADAVDRRIVSVLVTSDDCSLRHVGRVLGMQYSTLRYRLERLMENGVIVGFFYAVPPALYGLLPFHVHVYCRTCTAAFSARMRDFCRRHRDIDVFMELCGRPRFILGVTARDHREVAMVCDQIRSTFSDDVVRLEIVPYNRWIQPTCFELR